MDLNHLALKQDKDINKNDWCTPPQLFERLQEVFDFEVDGASDGKNNLLPYFHTVYTPPNIVRQNEEKYRVFINPPFNDQGKFVSWVYPNKLKCLLLPFRPETKMWHNCIWPFSSIFVFNKRINYVNPDNKKEVKGAAFPSCLVIFGSIEEYEIQNLNDLGIFIRKI